MDHTRSWIPEEMREVQGPEVHQALLALPVRSAGCYWSPPDRAVETASMALLLEGSNAVHSLRASFGIDGRIRALWLEPLDETLRAAILSTRSEAAPCSVFLIAGEPGFKSPDDDVLREDENPQGN